MVFGIILKVYQIIVPFLMRTAMIYLMGVQYTGLNSLFTSVLQVLNLAELGVGTAMVFSMYKPIAEDDDVQICALMRLYKIYYRIIGLVIAIVGGILTPFIPHLIHGSVPSGINIYILYILNLSATVLTYWLFAYRNSIFDAYQRIDVINKVTLITNTIQYAIQFFVLWEFHNYYMYVIALLFSQVMNNILIAIQSKRMYPQYDPVGIVSKEEKTEINHRIRDLFTSRVGGVIVNSADTLVISAFLGLRMLTVYQNYYYILTALIGIVNVAFQASTAGIGNSLILETQEKNFNDLKKFTLFVSWIATICSCCLLCIYQPFMKLWVGPKLLLPFSAVVCMVIYYYVFEINQLINTYKDAGGIWHVDRFRPLVTAIANLCMNLIMVQFWGIYGVLLSTVLSMVIVGMPWLFHNLFTTLFEKNKFKEYFYIVLKYSFVAILSSVLCILICKFIDGNLVMTIILRGIICIIFSNIIFILFSYRDNEFVECIEMIEKISKYKIKLDFLKKRKGEY